MHIKITKTYNENNPNQNKVVDADITGMDATESQVTATLPSIAGLLLPTGETKTLVIKKLDTSSNAVTVLPSGTDTIEHDSLRLITAPQGSMTVYVAGPGLWRVI